MKPLSSETAKFFSPLQFSAHDRIHLVHDETESKFAVECWNQYRGNDFSGNPIKDRPSAAVSKLIARFPEHKKITAYGVPLAYEAPITDYTVELINDLFPKSQLTFHDDYTKLLFDNKLLHSRNAEKCAEINSAYKENKIIPEHGWEFAADNPLAPYQEVALCLAMRSIYPTGGLALFMEQGTGKTPVGVAAVCNLAKMFAEANTPNGLQQQRMFRVLILCPNNVRANWESEFLKFATQPGKISVMRGTEIVRRKQLIDALRRDDTEDKYTVVISGYDSAKKSINALMGNVLESDDFKPFQMWDLIILDESQYIKSSRTKRWEAMEKLRDSAPSHLVLTGTPIANSVLDVYTQLEFLGKGYSGFSSFEGFRRFYGVYEMSASGHEALVDVQNLPFMRERLARHSFIVRKKEALPDLPDKLYDLREVEMTSDQAEYYKEVATQLYLEIEKDLTNDNLPRQMVINNVLTKLLRLAQITSGFMSWQPVMDFEGNKIVDKRIEYFYPNPKIEAIRELFAEKLPNQKTIVWACFKADISYIESALRDDGIDCVTFTGETSDADRKEAEYRFNFDPLCTAFIGNPAAGGTGLNLLGYPPGQGDDYETNCDHIIYYSQNWSALARGQSEDRANRRGTRVPTRITDLVVPRTIDEQIRTRVCQKQIHAMDVSDLRAVLKNVFKDITDYAQ